MLAACGWHPRRCALALLLVLCGLTLSASQVAAQNLLSPEQASSSEDSSSDDSDVPEHVSVEDVTSDAAIEQRLVGILRATGWFEEVQIQVRDSVAFIKGTAVDEDRKEWAGQLARNTQGVAAVVNQLRVEKTINLAEATDLMVASVRSLWEDFLAQSPLLAAGVVALLLTALASKLAHAVVARLGRRSRLRVSLQDLILQLITIGVWLIGLMIAAVIMFPGLTPSRALAVLGLGSVAVGFAFKDIFENFFAGVLILWKYPFDKGDFVECGEVRGRIEEITIRMTMVRQVDGKLVVVPNAHMFKNPVDVLTSRPARRTTVICGVAYDTDLNQAQEVLQKAVEGCETVKKDHEVEIFAQEFASSSINFEVTWWCGAKPVELRKSRDEVVRKAKQALDAADIEIPFPQRTLWLPEPVETRDSER